MSLVKKRHTSGPSPSHLLLLAYSLLCPSHPALWIVPWICPVLSWFRGFIHAAPPVHLVSPAHPHLLQLYPPSKSISNVFFFMKPTRTLWSRCKFSFLWPPLVCLTFIVALEVPYLCICFVLQLIFKIAWQQKLEYYTSIFPIVPWVLFDVRRSKKINVVSFLLNLSEYKG